MTTFLNSDHQYMDIYSPKAVEINRTFDMSDISEKEHDTLVVYVVDDSNGDRILARNNIEACGDEVYCNKGVNDGLDMVLRKGEYSKLPAPDVIIADEQQLPATGLEILDIAKKKYEGAKLILVSGTDRYQQMEIQKESYRHPIDLFIIKPITEVKWEEFKRIFLK